MTELQSKLLDIFEWYHNVCVNENLRYYMLGGTALGAKRHKGFIPWDDDIDVGMPREDYEKFIKLNKKYGDKYIIESPGENSDFIYPYSKVYDSETTLIESKRKNVVRGIFLDIFPLDGVGNSLHESERNFKKIDKNIRLLSTCTCAIRKGRKPYKNVAIIFSRCIPEFILSSKKLIKKIDALSKKIKYNESKYIANYAGAWHEKEISEKSWFGEPQLYKFEHLNVYGVVDMDAYLTRMYGDYMKLPPKEKQVTHHDYVYLNLNEAYIRKD